MGYTITRAKRDFALKVKPPARGILAKESKRLESRFGYY